MPGGVLDSRTLLSTFPDYVDRFLQDIPDVPPNLKEFVEGELNRNMQRSAFAAPERVQGLRSDSKISVHNYVIYLTNKTYDELLKNAKDEMEGASHAEIEDIVSKRMPSWTDQYATFSNLYQ